MTIRASFLVPLLFYDMNRSIIKPALIILLFCILGFFIYSNTLEVPFYFDDKVRIAENPSIRLTAINLSNLKKAAFGELGAENRPLGNISFALNYFFNRYNLRSYHITNIVIHILSGIFLYLVLKLTLDIYWPGTNGNTNDPERYKTGFNSTHVAFFSSLIWFVNPLHTQSVTYIVQRLNSMAAMFYMLSLYLYIKGRLTQKRPSSLLEQNVKTVDLLPVKEKSYLLFFSGSVVAWCMALGSKQIAVTLPLFILLYEWFFFQNLNKAWLRKSVKYSICFLIIIGIVALLFLGTDPLPKFVTNPDYA